MIDVFRASTAICTAIDYGIKEIIPVKELDEAASYLRQGYIVAAERQGEVVNGFNFGNSPFAFMDEKLKGQSVVMTTSNCTTAIHEAIGSRQILIGSFVNISSLVDYLRQRNEDIVLLCSGWKKRFSLEDTIFAGAMVERLQPYFRTDCDGSIAALSLYREAKEDIWEYLEGSSHRKRLGHLDILDDLKYCLVPDQCTAIPYYNGGSIKKLHTNEVTS